MAKVLEIRRTVVVELSQDEIDAIYNIVDMFYNEPTYKKYAAKLQILKQALNQHVKDCEPPF